MIRDSAILVLLTVQPVVAAGFELKSASPLSLTWQGMPLIVAENPEPEFAAKLVLTEPGAPGWDAVDHVWRADEKSRTRLEAAVSPDVFEFTLVRRIEAGVAGVVRYAFTVPHVFLDGCQGELVAGAISGKGAASGKGLTTGKLGPQGIKGASLLSYLRIHRPDGDLDFDFNPRGWWAGEKTITLHAAEWAMRRTGDGYVFSTAFSRTLAGTLQEFKFVIRRSPAQRVADVHPRTAVRWTDGYRNALQVNVGAARIKGFVNLSAQGGEEELARWDHPAAVRIERDERFAQTAPVRLEGASPQDAEAGAALQLRVPRDGHYLVNLLVGAPDRSLGPCELGAGEKEKRRMPPVAAGDYDTWTLVFRAADGRINLHFGGDFRLVAASVAPMLYENEDYLFQRGWWLSACRHPDDDLPD